MARPTALGMILCEQVIVGRGNGRRILFGLFDELTVDEFPYTAPPFVVYAALTDGRGRIQFDLTVTNLDTEEQLLILSSSVEIANPLAIVHLTVGFQELAFPSASHYLFELFGNNEPICHRRLRLN